MIFRFESSYRYGHIFHDYTFKSKIIDTISFLRWSGAIILDQTDVISYDHMAISKMVTFDISYVYDGIVVSFMEYGPISQIDNSHGMLFLAQYFRFCPNIVLYWVVSLRGRTLNCQKEGPL